MEAKFEVNEKNHSIVHKDPLNFKINNVLLEDIINDSKNKKQVEDLHIISKRKTKMIMDKFGQLLCIIFINPIKVKYIHGLYNSKYTDFTEENVKSTLQIDHSLNKLNIKFANFSQKVSGITYQGDYFKNKNLLNYNIGGDIIIKNTEIHYILGNNDILLTTKKEFDKNLLSSYFDKYCDYPLNNSLFYFYDSKSRQNLFDNFITLLNHDGIKTFKFTGPSGEGKSVSLLYFSRMFQNIIYLNIKLISKLFQKSEVDKYLEMILYEFNRLEFHEKKEEYKKTFEDTFKTYADKSPWELLEKLSSFLSNQKTKITLIFDQYKSKYITIKEFEKISSYLNSTFKLIICSSINNKEIGKAVADSLIKNRKKLVLLTVDNQCDIFYYMDLCPRKKFKMLFQDKNNNSRNREYKLFNYEPKYIKLLSNKKKLKDIKRHIMKKMKEHYTNLGFDQESYFFNLYSSIGKKINYDILPLNTIPLKYLNLKLGNNTFYIKYKFPFIRNIIEKKIKCIDAVDYFKKKKYNDNELYANLKGHYFEFASINNMGKLNNFFGCKIQYQITVKSIIKMEQCDEKKLEIDNEEINYQKKFIEINKNDLYSNKQNKLKNDLLMIEKNYSASNKNINYFLYHYLKKENQKIEKYFLSKKRMRNNEEKSFKKNSSKNIIKKIEKNKENDWNYYRNEKKDKEKNKNEEINEEEEENEEESENNEKKEKKNVNVIKDEIKIEGENDSPKDDK